MDGLTDSTQGILEYSKKLNKDCLQPNQISQGLYKCSPLAKQLLSYVIADLKVMKWSNSEVETYETIFRTSDFIKALGKARAGNKQKELIEGAIKEIQKAAIFIETDEKFESFSWVTHAVFDKKENKIQIEINHKLGQALVEYKSGFTAIQLIELGRLQSFYAMRYYEIALSWSGYKGKKGNAPGTWHFDYSVAELRKTFQLKDDEYSGRMTNFITKVVKNPLDEVNEKTNLIITFEKQKEGKNVVGFRFICSEKAERIKIESTDTPEMIEDATIVNQENQEIEYYKKNYPEEFEKALESVQTQGVLPFGLPRFTIADELDAVALLKSKGLK